MTAATATVTPTANVTAGNRLVVEVGVWNSSAATASAVTDSAGNTYTKVTSFAAADDTEMSIWTAPITVGGGTRPTVTARVTSSADIGVAVLEYSGLSPAAGLGSVDTQSHAVGKTTAAATVASGATPATTAPGEIALGFYNDSGFGTALVGGTGYTVRTNVSPNNTMDMLVEEQVLPAAGATPNATARTGANTHWLMATVVFQAGGGTATAPSAPTGVTATAGNGSATVSWTAPAAGGSTITSYTVTPYISATAQPATTVPGAPPATTTPITGLTNGIAYTFKVSAANAIGSGPASAASNAVTPGASPGGSWSSLRTMPIMALSSILTYNGNLVFWDGWQDPQPSVVWNPANPSTYTTINAPSSVFCDAGATLPDGRLLIAGGYGGLSTGNIGIVDTNIFDPATNAWTRAANMNQPRWYPSMTELADGRYVVISGNTTDASHWAETPEIYDPATNKWTLLTGVSTSQVHEEEYPFSYLLPNGKVLAMGPEEDVTYTLDVDRQDVDAGGRQRPEERLVGHVPAGQDPLLRRLERHRRRGRRGRPTAVLDMTAASPSWGQTAPMASARTYHTLTMLADGQVLAVGGAPNSNQQQHITTGVLTTEIWNPTTQTWSTGASMAAARNYHSTATLMPDATVLVTGGGHPNSLSDPGQFSSQIYSPSYLSNGARPTITSAPATATYGSPITVTTPDAASISAVNLVSLGASTHQLDMNQHFVPLSFTAGAGSLSVNAPADGGPRPARLLHALRRQRPGRPVGGVDGEDRPALVGHGSRRPDRGDGHGRERRGRAHVDGAQQRRQHHQRLHRHPLRGRRGPDPDHGDRQPAGPVGHRHRPDQRHDVHVHRHRDQCRGCRAGVGAVERGHADGRHGSTAPTFVQQKSARNPNTAALAVTPTNNVTAGNRLIVEVGVWNSAHTSATSVTDSAGNTYTKLKQFQASEGTELSVWSAPITDRRRHQARRHRPHRLVGRRRRGGGRVLGALAGRWRGGRRRLEPGDGHDVGRSRGPVGADAADDVGERARRRLLRRLRFQQGVDRRRRVHDTGQRVAVQRHAAVRRRSRDRRRHRTQRAGQHRGEHDVAHGHDRVQVGRGHTAGGAGRADRRDRHGRRPDRGRWPGPRPPTAAAPSAATRSRPSSAGVAQTPTTVTGSPPSSSAAVTGLTNGTTYTFTVTATNAVGTGPASAPSNAVTPAGATAPAAPIGASALPGSGSATVSWTAPRRRRQPHHALHRDPVRGCRGPGPDHRVGQPAGDDRIRQRPRRRHHVHVHGHRDQHRRHLTAVGAVERGDPRDLGRPDVRAAEDVPGGQPDQPTRDDGAPVVAGNRMVVEVGVWGSSSPTATSVTDNAGNVYTKVLGFVASEATEMTVWTAPITNGGGTPLVVTATTNRTADIGVAALEYAGPVVGGGRGGGRHRVVVDGHGRGCGHGELGLDPTDHRRQRAGRGLLPRLRVRHDAGRRLGLHAADHGRPVQRHGLPGRGPDRRPGSHAGVDGHHRQVRGLAHGHGRVQERRPAGQPGHHLAGRRDGVPGQHHGQPQARPGRHRPRRDQLLLPHGRLTMGRSGESGIPRFASFAPRTSVRRRRGARPSTCRTRPGTPRPRPRSGSGGSRARRRDQGPHASSRAASSKSRPCA